MWSFSSLKSWINKLQKADKKLAHPTLDPYRELRRSSLELYHGIENAAKLGGAEEVKALRKLVPLYLELAENSLFRNVRTIPQDLRSFWVSVFSKAEIAMKRHLEREENGYYKRLYRDL